MAGLSYEEFQKDNKPSKNTKASLSYDNFVAETNKPAKKPLLQRAGNFGKEVVRDVAKSFARVGSTLIDPLEVKITGKPVNTDYSKFGMGDIKPLGQGATTKEKAKDIAGGLIEAVSNAYGGGSAKSVITTGLKGQVKKAATRGFVEGAVTGFGNTFGKDLQEQKTVGESTLGGLKTAAIAGPLGGILGAGSSLLGRKTTGKVANEVTQTVDNPIDNVVANTTTDSISPITKGNRLEVKEAFDVADKLGFNMRKSVQILEEAGKKSGNDGYYSVTDIEDIAKKYTPDKTPTVVKPTNVPEPIIKGRVTAPKIDPQTGIPMTSKTPTNKATTKPNTTTPSKVISNVAPEQAQQIVPEQPSQFKPGTREFYNETITKDFEVDPKRVEDIALGFRTDTTSNVPTDAYLAFLKNKADETLDLDLIEKLKKSKVSSVSGQKLESNKLAREGNIVDITKEVEDALLKKRGISKNSIDKEAQDIANKISEVFDSLKNQTVTKNIVVDALEAIKCK